MIKLEDIGKIYKGETADFEALKLINLIIEDGEFLIISGASGSGKTTLLNIIGCLDTATSGLYYLNGKEVNSLKDEKLAELRNNYFGFVLQDFALLKNETAIFNVSIPLLIQNKTKSEILMISKKALEAVGLAGFERKKVVNLSGGQQQRVAIARAIATDSKVIIADEPTGQLDSNTGKEIMKLLAELNKQGKTVIVATHNPLMKEYADREIYLKDGEIQLVPAQSLL